MPPAQIRHMAAVVLEEHLFARAAGVSHPGGVFPVGQRQGDERIAGVVLAPFAHAGAPQRRFPQEFPSSRRITMASPSTMSAATLGLGSHKASSSGGHIASVTVERAPRTSRVSCESLGTSEPAERARGNVPKEHADIKRSRWPGRLDRRPHVRLRIEHGEVVDRGAVALRCRCITPNESFTAQPLPQCCWYRQFEQGCVLFDLGR